MKKALTLMMLVASLFIFASCGEKSTEEKIEDKAEEMKEKAEEAVDKATE